MYNQYDALQSHTFQEACKLAASGEEFSHLIAILNPSFTMRLRIYVQGLPEEIQRKTIYGRANMVTATKPAKRGKKR
jgi:hypothetical protein